MSAERPTKVSPKSDQTVRSDRLRDIIEVQSEIIKARLDPESAMEVVCQGAQDITSASGAHMILLDGNEMVHVRGTGLSEQWVGLRFTMDNSLAGRSLRFRTTQRCDDSETDPTVDREACRKVGIRSLIVVPLIHDERAIGILSVIAEKAHHFQDDDVEVLNHLANCITMVMQQASAFTEQSEAAEDVPLIVEFRAVPPATSMLLPSSDWSSASA
jgi:diguanylate cyclase